jgi:hypothetical protein
LPTKIGARFSLQTVKILRNWFSSHDESPYPSEEEKSRLQNKTGLSQTQIDNWLANARRRKKSRADTVFANKTESQALPLNIPKTPRASVTNTISKTMDPLERWVESPPESEAASITAINEALSSEPRLSLEPGKCPPSDKGSIQSIHQHSSASSAGTSTNESSASAYSFDSCSFALFPPGNPQGRRRRRKKKYLRQTNRKPLNAHKTFQCTFCTDTFERRYDWQRHEKSYHLSLERWVCMPDGCRISGPLSNGCYCVFCGEYDPSDDHLDGHNHSICDEKPLNDRTFYRKDHLVQHLRLVHGVEYLDWCMRGWRTEWNDVHSRCGFCSIMLASWQIREDHLAEHFKMGQTMADWNGDWGFESAVLKKIQNSMPPCKYAIHTICMLAIKFTRLSSVAFLDLIDGERNSPFPFSACTPPTESPGNAYELIKLELFYFMTNYEEKVGKYPTDEQFRLEACRVIFASEVLSENSIASRFSWLRDLFMASETIARQAQYGPLRSASENRLAVLKINGKDQLFDLCPLEQELQHFFYAASFPTTNADLQKEATQIIHRVEMASTTPWGAFADWLVRIASSSSDWLLPFHQRAHNSKHKEFSDVIFGQPLPNGTQMDTFDDVYEIPSIAESMNSKLGGITDYPRPQLIHEQADFVYPLSSLALTGNDENIYHDATIEKIEPTFPSEQSHGYSPPMQTIAARTAMAEDQGKYPALSLPNDTNAYHRLARDLHRFVKTTISPYNPFQHIPTDEELQHQARFILYDE